MFLVVWSNHKIPLKAEFLSGWWQKSMWEVQSWRVWPTLSGSKMEEAPWQDTQAASRSWVAINSCPAKNQGLQTHNSKDLNSLNDEHELAHGFFLRASDKNWVQWAPWLQISDTLSSKNIWVYPDCDLRNGELMVSFLTAKFVVTCYNTIEN